MGIVIMLLVGIISYVVGIFGWAQIVGSFQSLKQRGIGMSILTIMIWVGIIFGTYLLTVRFFNNQLYGYYFGMIISFIQIISSGRME